jgi:hypothetical protein
MSSITQMDADAWRAQLQLEPAYPPELARQILDGIINGVSVGFKGDRQRNRDAPNLGSATKDPRVRALVGEAIAKDVRQGKKSGPHTTPPFPFFSVSPIGAVPKDTDSVRVIHHLSYPYGADSISINAGIEREPLELGRFDDACNAVMKAGRGCFLIKLDVEAAYKQVPVRVEDRALLGLRWEGMYYYELVLPFGLRSSGVRWELFAAALHHFFRFHLGIKLVIHYVDDFLFVVAGSLKKATAAKDGAVALCAHLRVPMSVTKQIGPVTCLPFLGIELDTERMEARLGQKRLDELQQLLLVWGDEKHDCSLKELQSLTGKLNFACGVVRRGRAYLRRLIDMQHKFKSTAGATASSRHHLTHAARADVRWWRDFLVDWNGRGLLFDLEWTTSTTIQLFTDACKEGYGAAYGNRWLRGVWSEEQLQQAMRKEELSIPYLELRALVYAAAAWGRHWEGKRITFRCDCQPVCFAVDNMKSKDSDIQALLRHLDMTAARCGFEFRCEHIKGEHNTVADLLSRPSRFSMQALRALLPDANAEPDPTPELPPLNRM